MITKKEEILNKADQLAEKYFPDSQNIWARPNIEAQKVKYACIEMAEWLEKAMIEKARKWLYNNTYKISLDDSRLSMNFEYTIDMIDNFCKAMEE